MADVHRERTQRCQAALNEIGGQAVILSPGPNLFYLAGLALEPSERYMLFVVPADGEPTLFVPAMAESEVREDSWVDVVETYRDDEHPRDRFEEVATERGIGSGRVLVDDHLGARFTLDLQATFPDASFGLASDVLADLRISKDSAELDSMRAAASLTDEVCASLRDDVTVLGHTEAELTRTIEDRQRAAGGAGAAFETIVASGPNGAKPHHGHGDREIRPGDPVVIDFGTVLDGYVSDQTRTMVFGRDPPNGFEDVFEAVRAAHHAGVEAVEPGVPCEAVDRAARSVIKDHGYGEAFVHRTGHGVGLEVHEPPYIVSGNDRELEPGMVFSVEPGVYLEGRFGVRIEDLVVVTADGWERLNDSPRGWRID